MNRIIISTSLVVLAAIYTPAAYGNVCNLLLGLEVRRTSDQHLDYHNDVSYIEMHKRRKAMGVMTSRFDAELDTRIYHGNTALPDLNTGELPAVDPRAKGLFVFLHGSGTMSATGKNFLPLINLINEYGLAGLSFDFPYHADGPINEKHKDPKYFMNWIRKLIDKYRVPGMPVYFIGHSYGAELIPEYMLRFPGSIDGGLSVSLVGFNSALQKWYEQKVTKMNFEGVVHNTAGDQWADDVASNFLWNKSQFHIPNWRVLVGDREEFVPGPTKGKAGKPSGPNTYDYRAAVHEIIPNATVTVEKGVGHYIFEHRDENGRNAILRDMLLVAGLDPSLLDEKQIIKSNSQYPNTESALQKYASDPFFRAWAQIYYGSDRAFFQMIRKSDETVSKRILLTYEAHKKQREENLNL